jgi:site-specific recombinase XerD
METAKGFAAFLQRIHLLPAHVLRTHVKDESQSASGHCWRAKLTRTRAGYFHARAESGHLETVQKQFKRAKRMAGLPESVVLYCARHRFSTDAMEGTGNLMAVMDAMGQEKIDTTRLNNHPGTKQIRDAIERRNQLVQ